MPYPVYQHRVDELYDQYKRNPQMFSPAQINELEELAKQAGIGRKLLKRIEAGDIFILETAIHLLHVLEAGVGVLQLAEHLRLQEARHRVALDVARRAGQEE